MNKMLAVWYVICCGPSSIIVGWISYLMKTNSLAHGGPAAVSGDEVKTALYLVFALLWVFVFVIINLSFLKWRPDFIKNTDNVAWGVVISAAPVLFVIVDYIFEGFINSLFP